MKDPIEQQMDIEESRNLTRNPAEAGFAGAPGSAFRLLSEGEIIQENDEFLDDSGTWRKTICAGESAPNPVFTSHRQYRRRILNSPNNVLGDSVAKTTNANALDKAT